MLAFLKKLDGAIYRVERWFVAVALGVMAILVTLDVVWRTSAMPGGLLARILQGLLGAAEGDAAATLVEVWLAPLVAWVLIFLVVLAGVSTARYQGFRPDWGRRVLLAVVITGGLWLGRYLLLLLPNGLIGAQRISLVLLLWVGFVGASMAAHQWRHIRVDAALKVYPQSWLPWIRGTAALVTAAFCLFILGLGLIYLHGNWVEWIESDGRAGVFQILPIPYWLANLCIPVTFTVMTLRFLGQAWVHFSGGAPPESQGTH